MKISPALLFANFSFLVAAPATAFAQAQLYTYYGPPGAGHFGNSVSGAGDLDADGVSDLLIGSTYSSVGAPVGGQAFAYSGRTGALMHTWTGTVAGETLGWAVAPAGDFNGDGAKDVAVSVFGAPPYGEVRVYSGSTGALVATKFGVAGEALGRALAGGSDLNGDGWPDLVVGASSTNGTVRAYSNGSSTHFPGGVLYTLSGLAAGDMFGRSVAVAGDMNLDGFPDIVVGAPGNDVNGSGAGMVRAFNGNTGTGPIGWTWFGDDLADSLGESVAGAGDVDGDGYADVIAGAPYWAFGGSTRGYARIYSGRTGAVIRSLYGDPDWLYFGTAVAGVGDIDGDGKAEVAVSATYGYAGPLTDGFVRVFSGASGAPLLTLIGDSYDSWEFGKSMASTGDLNGDGRGDLIVGSSENSIYDGGARVFLTGCAPPLVYCAAKTNSLGCLPAIAHSGAPSVSIGNNFTVSASNVRNKKPGLLLWGLGAATIPLGGGTLCIAPPITRTPGQDSAGSPIPASDCSGTYSFTFTHAYMASKGIIAGTTAYAQFWSRDPGYAPPNNIGLTDAVSFVACP